MTQTDVNALADVDVFKNVTLSDGRLIEKRIGNCTACVFYPSDDCSRILVDNFHPKGFCNQGHSDGYIFVELEK